MQFLRDLVHRHGKNLTIGAFVAFLPKALVWVTEQWAGNRVGEAVDKILSLLTVDALKAPALWMSTHPIQSVVYTTCALVGLLSIETKFHERRQRQRGPTPTEKVNAARSPGTDILGSLSEHPALRLEFQNKRLANIGINERSFMLLRNVGERSASNIEIAPLDLGGWHIEFGHINSIDAHDTAIPHHATYHDGSFFASSEHGPPARGLRAALRESSTDILKDEINVRITCEDVNGTQFCTNQVIHYEFMTEDVTHVSTARCSDPVVEIKAPENRPEELKLEPRSPLETVQVTSKMISDVMLGLYPKPPLQPLGAADSIVLDAPIPARVRLLFQKRGVDWTWRIHNKEPREIGPCGLKITNQQSFDSEIMQYREPSPFLCGLGTTGRITAGDLSKEYFFSRVVEGGHLEIGDSRLTRLPWPTGDQSVIHQWMLELEFSGLTSLPTYALWAINLVIRWDTKYQTLTFVQYSSGLLSR